MNIYVAGPIAGGNPQAKHLLSVVRYLRDEDHFILTPFVFDPKVNDARFTELDLLGRNNAITNDDIKKLIEAEALISFVSPTSYGMGFEEGFSVARKLLTDKPIKILKLMHQDDWETNRSKIAGNSIYSELKIYANSKQAVSFTRAFMKNFKNLEGNLRNKERE